MVKKLIGKKVLLLAMAASVSGLSAPTYANSHYFKFFACNLLNAKCGSADKWDNFVKEEPEAVFDGGGQEVLHAPEIDGAQTGLALALLAGVLAISRERSRRKNM